MHHRYRLRRYNDIPTAYAYGACTATYTPNCMHSQLRWCCTRTAIYTTTASPGVCGVSNIMLDAMRAKVLSHTISFRVAYYFVQSTRSSATDRSWRRGSSTVPPIYMQFKVRFVLIQQNIKYTIWRRISMVYTHGPGILTTWDDDDEGSRYPRTAMFWSQTLQLRHRSNEWKSLFFGSFKIQIMKHDELPLPVLLCSVPGACACCIPCGPALLSWDRNVRRTTSTTRAICIIIPVAVRRIPQHAKNAFGAHKHTHSRSEARQRIAGTACYTSGERTNRHECKVTAVTAIQ